MTGHEYLESRGWRSEFQSSEDDPRRWLKDDHNCDRAEALWIEWQDLAQCFAECVVAVRVHIVAGSAPGTLDAFIKAALDKHKININIKG